MIVSSLKASSKNQSGARTAFSGSFKNMEDIETPHETYNNLKLEAECRWPGKVLLSRHQGQEKKACSKGGKSRETSNDRSQRKSEADKKQFLKEHLRGMSVLRGEQLAGRKGPARYGAETLHLRW